MEDSDKLLLKIQTKQTGAFRILIEALKEILTEANFIFDESVSNKWKDAFNILGIDPNKLSHLSGNC